MPYDFEVYGIDIDPLTINAERECKLCLRDSTLLLYTQNVPVYNHNQLFLYLMSQSEVLECFFFTNITETERHL